MTAAVGETLFSQPHTCQVFCCTDAVKSDPEIGPGIGLARLIECLYPRFDEKTLSGTQFIGRPLGVVNPFSFQNAVDNIVGTDGRAKAVARKAFLVSAEAEIQIGKLTPLCLKNIRIFHGQLPFSAHFRYSVGVRCFFCLNKREKYMASSYPTDRAMSLMGSAVSRRRVQARRMR